MSQSRRHSAEMGPHASRMGTARLYLVTPPLGDAGAIADALADALNAADIAVVLVRLEDGDEAALLERVKTLRILIQSNGAALLLDGHGARGARGMRRRAPDRNRRARGAAPGLSEIHCSCGGLGTRHDAMLAGQSGPITSCSRAERPPAGFDAVIERVAWWTEIPGSLRRLCGKRRRGRGAHAARAPVVAVGEAVWRSPASLRAAAERLAAEPVR